jgi:hypothetical protein
MELLLWTEWLEHTVNVLVLYLLKGSRTPLRCDREVQNMLASNSYNYIYGEINGKRETKP